MLDMHAGFTFKAWVSTFIILCAFSQGSCALAVAVKDTGPWRITTKADFRRWDNGFSEAIVKDTRTGKVLYSYKADDPWPAASLSKLTNALVLLDTKPNWNKIVNIKTQDEVGGGRLRVADGATLTMKDMLVSAISGSANNAAMAFARITKMGVAKYVLAMDKKAKALGCKTTTFKDPSGMDVGNITSASDMAKIAMVAFSKPEIRFAATTPIYNFRILNSGVLHTIKNTNYLLLDEKNGLYVTGGKTGYLVEAKNNLAVRLKPAKNDNRELMIVVLGADTKDQVFEQAEALARWAWTAYDWHKPAKAVSYGTKNSVK